MEDKQVTTNEIMDLLHEQMEFLQDNMVMKEEFESRMNNQKLQILDGMDEKLGALKGDLVVMMRGEDKKVVALIEILKKKQILEESEASALLALHPFPQMSV